MLLGSLNATALTTVDVLECAKGVRSSPTSNLNDSSVYRSIGPRIFKIKPDAGWGSLSTAIFTSKEDQNYCYKLSPETNPIGQYDIMKVKKSSMKASELKSCKAHQIPTSLITNAELDILLGDLVSAYAMDMHAVIEGGSSKAEAEELVKGFEKCEFLKPMRDRGNWEFALDSAASNRDELVRRYHIKLDNKPSTSHNSNSQQKSAH